MVLKSALPIGAIYGATGVMLGAFGAHGLKGVLSPERMESFQTGVQYQLLHALALLFLYLLWRSNNSSVGKLVKAVFWCWSIGVLFFSGSIYLLVLAGTTYLWFVTPLGGLLLISGWVCLLIYSLSEARR